MGREFPRAAGKRQSENNGDQYILTYVVHTKLKILEINFIHSYLIIQEVKYGSK